MAFLFLGEGALLAENGSDPIDQSITLENELPLPSPVYERDQVTLQEFVEYLNSSDRKVIFVNHYDRERKSFQFPIHIVVSEPKIEEEIVTPSLVNVASEPEEEAKKPLRFRQKMYQWWYGVPVEKADPVENPAPVVEVSYKNIIFNVGDQAEIVEGHENDLLSVEDIYGLAPDIKDDFYHDLTAHLQGPSRSDLANYINKRIKGKKVPVFSFSSHNKDKISYDLFAEGHMWQFYSITGIGISLTRLRPAPVSKEDPLYNDTIYYNPTFLKIVLRNDSFFKKYFYSHFYQPDIYLNFSNKMMDINEREKCTTQTYFIFNYYTVTLTSILDTVALGVAGVANVENASLSFASNEKLNTLLKPLGLKVSELGENPSKEELKNRSIQVIEGEDPEEITIWGDRIPDQLALAGYDTIPSINDLKYPIDN